MRDSNFIKSVLRGTFMRSQTATEYLIILAVVITIGMIVASTLGVLPSMGSGSDEAAVRARWGSNTPVGISEWTTDTIGTQVRFVNNGRVSLTITGLSVEGRRVDIDRRLPIGGNYLFTHIGSYEPTEESYQYDIEINYTETETGTKYTINETDLDLVGTSSTGDSNLGADLLRDLVGWWRFDESSWTADSADAVDSSGNGLTGTVRGDAATTTDGVLRNAGMFDGTGDYLDIADVGNALDFSESDSFSITFWMKADSDSNSGIITNWNSFPFFAGPTSEGWFVRYAGRAIEFGGSDRSEMSCCGEQVFTTTQTLGTGIWHHVCISYTGEQAIMYINGSLDSTHGAFDALSYDGWAGSGIPEERIGWYEESSSELDYDGQIDEVMVFARALSADEIKQIYQMGR
mgnify:CR=1 FL=1